jgi:hypothetical protein
MQKSKLHTQVQNALKILNFALPFCILIFTFCIFLFAQEEFIYNSKSKRDPFIPLVTSDGRLLKLDKEEGEVDLLVEGIMFDEHGLSYCLINGQIVKIGDVINEYQVLKIEKDKAVFIKDGQPLEIELKKEEP